MRPSLRVWGMICLFLLLLATPLWAEEGGCQKAKLYVDEANRAITTEPEKAEALLKEALKACPESISTTYNLAVAQYGAGKAGDAIETLKALLENEPDHTPAMRLLAYILVKEGMDPERGKLIAERLLDKNPRDKGAKSIVVMALTGPPSTQAIQIRGERRSSTVSTTPATSDVDRDIPKTATKNPNSIAVIIGNRDYQHPDIPSVDYALNDAEAVKRYLINVLGYREGNIIFEPNATKARFEAIFGTRENHRGKLYNWLKKGKSDIFIYYSGHGAPDPRTKQGFFVPTDADPEAISLTGYSLKQLYANVAKIAKEMKTPSTVIVIDACFSGATEKGLLLKNVSPISIEVKNPLLTIPNAVVMTSARGTEVSSWYPEKGHSMFTYFFLKALKEEAEKKSQKVTAGRIFRLVTDETEGLPYYARRLYGRVQRPQLMGNKKIVLIRK